MQSILAGRCIICNMLTNDSEEDDEEVEEASAKDEANRIMLCDGCNSEAHMSCLGLTDVPKGNWFCLTCETRRNEGKVSSLSAFENIDSYRSSDAETALIDLKAKNVNVSEVISVSFILKNIYFMSLYAYIRDLLCVNCVVLET